MINNNDTASDASLVSSILLNLKSGMSYIENNAVSDPSPKNVKQINENYTQVPAKQSPGDISSVSRGD